MSEEELQRLCSRWVPGSGSLSDASNEDLSTLVVGRSVREFQPLTGCRVDLSEVRLHVQASLLQQVWYPLRRSRTKPRCLGRLALMPVSNVRCRSLVPHDACSCQQLRAGVLAQRVDDAVIPDEW